MTLQDFSQVEMNWRWSNNRPRREIHPRWKNNNPGWEKHWKWRINNQRWGEDRKEIISLYVQNLPTKLHWSGLRQTFGRHGDVVDSFIAGKKNKAGKRFGFVRFSNRVDAERAIERLDEFNLYGYRLSVSFAKYKTRTSYWRKVTQKETLQEQELGAKVSNQSKDKKVEKIKNPIESIEGTSSKQSYWSGEKELKRIEGFIEEEALNKLYRCAMGTMATVCSISSVENRLQNWGLGEISIKRMGGRRFLIEFKDHELYEFLKEQNWSYLLEVFTDVEPWSESFHLPERITWIQVEGIPLHCWNQITFNRIAEVWGNLLALGENANQSLDGNKITLLVSTSERKNLDGVLELEAGRECCLIRAKELGFNIHATFKSVEETRKISPSSPVSDKEASSESSSVNSKPPSINLEDRRNLGGDDSIIVLSMGTQKNKTLDEYRQVGEDFILGFSKDNYQEGDSYKREESPKKGSKEEGNDTGFNEKVLEVGVRARINSQEDRAREDTLLMGFKRGELAQHKITESVSDEDISGEQIMESREDFTWAEKADLQNSPQPNQEAYSNLISSGYNYKRNKKYGSLASLQNKAISSVERKRRDRAQRKLKKNWFDRELSSLEGRSLSDSDIRSR
ncbi:hypothetical protein V6N13_071201 [Hibiscus sabdariffa]